LFLWIVWITEALLYCGAFLYLVMFGVWGLGVETRSFLTRRLKDTKSRSFILEKRC